MSLKLTRVNRSQGTPLTINIFVVDQALISVNSPGIIDQVLNTDLDKLSCGFILSMELYFVHRFTEQTTAASSFALFD